MTGNVWMFERVMNKVCGAASVIACVLCGIMALHIAIEAFSRTVLDNPLPGTVAIVSHYYMIAVTFLPLALVEKRDASVSVEILVQRFPTAAQRACQLFGYMISASAFCLLAYVSWKEAMRRYEVGTYVMESGYEITLWPTYFMPSLGFGLATIVLINKILRHLTGPASGNGAEEPRQAG